MSIAPKLGVRWSQIHDTLVSIRGHAHNLHSRGSRSGPGSSAEKLWAYLEWVRESERQLTNVVSPADARRILDWAGYEHLMAMAPAWAASVGGNPQERVLHALLTDEITRRCDNLDS